MGFEEPTCSLTNWLEDFGHCSLGRARNVQKITGGWPQSLSSPDLGSGIGRGDVLASTPWVQWKGPACCPAAWPNPSADAGHCEFQGKQSTTSYQMHSNAIIVSILQSYYSHTTVIHHHTSIYCKAVPVSPIMNFYPRGRTWLLQETRSESFPPASHFDLALDAAGILFESQWKQWKDVVQRSAPTINIH